MMRRRMMMVDTNDHYIRKILFTTHLLSKHCNSFSNGCATKWTSSHSRYIGSTISTQTKMIARTKQDGFLSILTNHTKKIEAGLGALFPTTFVPVYTMIAFRDIPYDEALRRAHQQEAWVSRLIALHVGFLGLCAAGAAWHVWGPYWKHSS